MRLLIDIENIEKKLFTRLIAQGYVPTPKELEDFSICAMDVFLDTLEEQLGDYIIHTYDNLDDYYEDTYFNDDDLDGDLW